MELTEYTLSVLKNFSTINPGIILKKGKLQRTMAPDKSILAEAEIENDFPYNFGIYDLNQFLGNVSIFPNVALENTDQSEVDDASLAVLSDAEMNVAYHSCAHNLIIAPPADSLEIDNVDAQFELPNRIFQKAMKVANMNSLSNIAFVGKGGKVSVKAYDRQDPTSTSGLVAVGECNNDFEAIFKTENLKLMPDDYVVEVNLQGFAKFTSKNHNLKYFVALESV